MSLTENQLKALKPRAKAYKVSDERGLYIEVAPTGSKLWRYRYRIGRIEKKLSIGTYPELSLKMARQAALEARMAVASRSAAAWIGGVGLQFMRDNRLSNRVFTSHDNIINHCCDAWNKLIDQPWHIMTIGRRKWAHGS